MTIFHLSFQLIEKEINFQHLLIRLREEWRLHLDNNYFVRTVMTDLPKAFDCIPHDVLIVKLEAYG